MPIITKNNKKEKNDINFEEKTQDVHRNNSNNLNFKLSDPIYNLSDMILPKQTKDKINDVICSRDYRKMIFEDWGLGHVLPEFKNKIAVNLYGKPGTGKTMAAHAIANALNKKLLKINYAEIESKYVGETAKNLEKAFREAKEQNAILFFDEADALLSRRVTNMSNSTDVSVNQTRSVLLMLMNTYEDIILFTTNFISNFDEAFMRRIQYHIKFELPSYEARKLLWGKYIPKKMPNDADINMLALKYENISGSDIANAVLAASFKAAREQELVVRNSFFEEAIESIVDSKNDNISITKADKSNIKIEKRYVDEEYVKSQIGENRGYKE